MPPWAETWSKYRQGVTLRTGLYAFVDDSNVLLICIITQFVHKCNGVRDIKANFLKTSLTLGDNIDTPRLVLNLDSIRARAGETNMTGDDLGNSGLLFGPLSNLLSEW